MRQRRESRSLIYSANYRAMTALVGYLTENCCGGNLAACAPALAAHSAAASAIVAIVLAWCTLVLP